MKWPFCLTEEAVDRSLEIDEDVRCLACGTVSEYGEFRELCCASRRAALTDACPEILFPGDRLDQRR
ncbi:MAG: hypothetical protein ABI843_09045 [Dokdonella sp.]